MPGLCSTGPLAPSWDKGLAQLVFPPLIAEVQGSKCRRRRQCAACLSRLLISLWPEHVTWLSPVSSRTHIPPTPTTHIAKLNGREHGFSPDEEFLHTNKEKYRFDILSNTRRKRSLQVSKGKRQIKGLAIPSSIQAKVLLYYLCLERLTLSCG